MSKKLYRWSIYIKETLVAKFLGSVQAPDEETAIKTAIAEYRVVDRQKQQRLIALRQG